ncbi:MAG: MFS transporter [Dermatophilaceae bacterium]
MRVGQYRLVLALRGVRSVLLLGLFVRMPMFAGGLVLTVHVVSTLGRSYGEAGLVAAVFTIAIAVSAPWRGRILDRVGLRRTVLPSVVVETLAWSTAPFVRYELLLPIAVLAGLFVVPTFSILRQALIVAVPSPLRRTALSLDSVFTELAFMIGPAFGVWAAVTWDTRWTLVWVQLASVLATLALMAVDPPMRSPSLDTADADRSDDQVGGEDGQVHPDDTEPADPGSDRRWVSPAAVAVLVAAGAATVVLGGTDVAIVAALRSTDNLSSLGWVMALWGAGSLMGGLVYGAWHRSIPVFWLLGGLSAFTVPVALAGSLASLTVLLVLCGVLCAPTITATVEALSRLVAERARGEAMGWHGSAMTTGQAVGAPFAGFAIDHGGWQWGFLSVSLVGLAVALIGGAAVRVLRRRSLPRQDVREDAFA